MPRTTPPKGTPAHAEYRRKMAAQKRRWRDQLRARGLTAHGKVPVYPERVGRMGHPRDCICFDCLGFSRPASGVPRRVYSVRGLKHG